MSAYQAKAYVALVSAGVPLNGYEVAKQSRVPRSTVYEVLDKLVARGAAFKLMTEGGGSEYLPLPVEALMDRLTREFDTSVESLRGLLTTIAVDLRVHLIYNISGRAALMDRFIELLRSAQRELYVSAWPDELEVLHPLLVSAQRAGVEVFLLSFGTVNDASLEHMYLHTLSPPNQILSRLGCRLSVAVADRREVVIGGLLGPEAWGVFTDNPAVVQLAGEYVRHDIAIQLMGHHFDRDAVSAFWEHDPDLQQLRPGPGTPPSPFSSPPRSDRSTAQRGPAQQAVRDSTRQSRRRRQMKADRL